jgi:ribosomal protein S18 acetylase RimI-like enzyme
MNLQENALILREKFFPLIIIENVVVRSVDSSMVEDFIKANFQAVFGDEGRRRVDVSPERKELADMTAQDFRKVHCEDFLFYFNDVPIGWSYGETHDFMTFYMRNSGVLPEYRNKGIYQSFLKHFLVYLTELGYERVVSHHKPNNAAVLISKLKAGFLISGMEYDERWGLLVKMAFQTQAYRRKKFDEGL